MISERVGDLLRDPDLTHIAHQANLYHCFGGGLAAAIARRYPYAVAADRKTAGGFRGKLGTFSVGIGDGPTVLNLYSQDGMGLGSTDYTSMRRALTAVDANLRMERGMGATVRLGLPYRLGCGIAGGSWPRVYGILEAVFGRSPVAVVIVRLPEEVE